MIYLVGLIWRSQKKAQNCRICGISSRHYQMQQVMLKKKGTYHWFLTKKKYPVCRECAD